MKNKGFTLIELLAVIVILSIISIIAVPLVLNIINDTRKQALTNSVENYFNAIELAIGKEYMFSPQGNLDGTYEIKDKGKQIESENKKLDIDYDGNLNITGTLIIENGKVTKIIGGKTDKYFVKIILDRVKLLESLSPNVLSISFKDKIKTLANNNLNNITSIEFLSNGKIPEGHTYATLQQLDSIDVSESQDETILALYENGKVYIFSEDLISLSSGSNMFYNMRGLTSVTFGEIDTSKVTYMSKMFHGCSNLIELDLSSFDTGNVKDMSQMFVGCNKLTTLDLSSFDTSSVTNMEYMFSGCLGLKELDVSNWNTSNVTNMSSMFNSCNSLTQLDVSNFTTSKVKKMDYMFSGCNSLTKLDVSRFNTSNVTDMVAMFDRCMGLKELDVSNWNTSNVTGMAAMFNDCSNLTTLDLSSFDTSNVTTFYNMFYGTTNLKSILVNKEKWKYKEGVNKNYMFSGSGVSDVTYITNN